MGGTSGAGGGPPPLDENITLRMAGSTVANISGNILSRAFDILTFLFLARYLGVDRFGQFSFVFAFVGIFSVFVDFGVNYILIRDISKPEADKEALLGAGVSLKFFLSLTGVAAACLAIMVLDYPGPVRAMVAIVSLNLLISFRFPSFRDVFEVPLICGLKMKYSAAAAVMNRGLSFAAVLIAIYFKASLVVVALVYTVISLPAFLLIVHFSNRLIKPAIAVKVRAWKYLLKEGFPLGLGTVFFIIFSQFDIFLLSRFWTDKEIGFYSSSRRLTEPLELIPVALAFSILPVMSRYGETSGGDVIKIYNKSLLYLMLIVAPITVFLAGFPEPVISVLFGGKFLDARKSLVLLSLYLPFIFIWHIGGAVFIALKRQTTTTFIWLTALLLNLVMNLFLIPARSFVGAGIARLITGIMVALLSLCFVSRLAGKVILAPAAKVFFIACSMFGALQLFLRVHAALAVLAAAAVYAAGLLLLRVLGKDDIQFIKSVALAGFQRTRKC